MNLRRCWQALSFFAAVSAALWLWSPAAAPERASSRVLTAQSIDTRASLDREEQVALDVRPSPIPPEVRTAPDGGVDADSFAQSLVSVQQPAESSAHAPEDADWGALPGLAPAMPEYAPAADDEGTDLQLPGTGNAPAGQEDEADLHDAPVGSSSGAPPEDQAWPLAP